MAGNVEFKDYSIEVKAAIDDETIAWLHTWSNEIAAQAQRNCQMAKEGEQIGRDLRGSYQTAVDESKGNAEIGSALEAAFWEEFGTGEYAAHGDGRKGWWVYVKGQASRGGGKTYRTKEEAEDAASFLRSRGLEAVATNGRPPNYTLGKAFTTVKPKAVSDLETRMKARMD